MATGVTVREVLELPALRGARVVGGGSGLNRSVRQVNVMEVPDILKWVKPDELLLTTAYPLRDDRAALTELIPGLSARGLAGMAIKPARYIDSIPPGMTEAADRLSFPLIELPPEAVLGEIINSVLSAVLNEQSMRLQRAATIHDRFTAIALGGGGLREIAEALGQSIGRQVVIVDARGTLQTSAPNLAGGAVEALSMEETVAQPIQVGPERFGSIVVMARPSELGEDDRDALEHAATVAALRQVQARAVAEADRRFQTVCLEELVTGHVTDRGVLMERAVSFAWDLAVPRAVMLLQLDEVGGRAFPEIVGTAEETLLRHRLADAARLALGRNAIIWERSVQVAALVDAGTRGLDGLRKGAERLAAEARRAAPDGVASIGVGGIETDPLRLQHSYLEARRSLAIGKWGKGPGQITLFGSLGVDRLLVELDKTELSEFSSGQLDPLVEYDARHHSDLIESLGAYLETRNAAMAARKLFVHYNTMKNRLRAIEELIGPFREDPDRCLGLAIALRIRQLPTD